MSKKKGFRMPDTMILILGIITLMAGLTWVVQSGEYQREKNYNGDTVVISGSYHTVPSTPTSLMQLLTAPLKGAVDAAEVIVFILIVAGVFNLINRTGAMGAGIESLVNLLKDRMAILFFIIMTVLALGGTTTGTWEETMPFYMLVIPIVMKLGLDPIVGVAMIILGAGTGNIASTINPFATGIASGLADVTLNEGLYLRAFIFATFVPISIMYTLRYAYSVRRDRRNSLVVDRFPMYEKEFLSTTQDVSKFTFAHKLILLVLFSGISLMFYGVIRLDWYITELSAVYVAIGIFAAAVARLSERDTVDSFIEGAKDVVYAALLIGFSRAIILIAQDGKIIDTILHAVASILQNFNNVVFLNSMLFVQHIIAFLVPSSSGHAALTISIMSGLADIIQFPRELVVTVFQVASGVVNLITPTSGVLVGALAIAKVPYQTWLKFVMPLILILFVYANILFAAYYLINYSAL